MQRLDYELTNDDYVAFNQHAAVTAPALVGQARRVRVAGTVVVPVVAGLGLWVLERDPVQALFVAAVGAAVVWFSWPPIQRATTAVQLKRMSAATGLGRTGPTTLVWDDHWITESASATQASVGWERLDRVEETPQHVFLFVGPLEGLVVPKRAGVGASELARYARERIAGR
ncbi:MAG: YcxB family protein [Propionicimonas sp.]|nr:YcxB family protein [Propionicimonas sp.]